jgi:hypothetical protein
MTGQEFHKTAKINRIANRKTVDVRPFGERQPDAVDFYLHELIKKIEKEGLLLAPGESIVVWCDRGTVFHYSTLEYYRKLWGARIAIKIKEKD